MRILIAEDDSVSRLFMMKFFSCYGECEIVTDGLEALNQYSLSVKNSRYFDLICLDIMMPKVDGVKVLKAIRNLETQRGILPEKRAKIIMITALAETQFVKNAFEAGCDGYISKPVDVDKMINLMKEIGFIKKQLKPTS